MIDEQVDGTIYRVSQQRILGPVIYTSITPALGKWVTNSATSIVNLKDYKNEIVYIFEYGPQRLSASRWQG